MTSKKMHMVEEAAAAIAEAETVNFCSSPPRVFRAMFSPAAALVHWSKSFLFCNQNQFTGEVEVQDI